MTKAEGGVKTISIHIAVWARHQDAEPVEVLRWDGYSVEMLSRWRWYFRYREALLVLKHPKAAAIETKTFATEAHGQSRIHQLTSRVSARQGLLTKHLNKITEARERYEEANRRLSPLFEWPPFETLPDYCKVEEKTRRLTAELEAALSDLDNLRDSMAS